MFGFEIPIFNGVSLIAWALLFFMIIGMVTIVVVVVAENIITWLEYRSDRKRHRFFSDK